MARYSHIAYSCIAALLMFTGLHYAFGQDNRHVLKRAPLALKVIDKPATDTIDICILGDMMMHRLQISTASTDEGTYDFSTYFRYIEEDIRNADISIANMEFTLAGPPYSGYPCFSAPDSFTTYLAGCGFDIFLTANNHIFDKGTEGASRTLDVYRQLEQRCGIRFTGLAGDKDERDANNPLTINCRGAVISIINFTYGTNLGTGSGWPKVNYMADKKSILEALKRSEGSDLTVAMPHWGQEYNLKHSENQRHTAEWLITNGADLIIGSHPHVVQDQETIDGKTVIYSVGNAVSNMSAQDTQIELMVTIRMVRQHNGRTRMLDPEFKYLWCSRPGGYNSSYTVIPVEEFIGTRDEWQGSWEYDKMISTYNRVTRITGIKDNSTK